MDECEHRVHCFSVDGKVMNEDSVPFSVSSSSVSDPAMLSFSFACVFFFFFFGFQENDPDADVMISSRALRLCDVVEVESCEFFLVFERNVKDRRFDLR